MQSFRVLGILEGTSLLLLLFIAMPLKYGMGIPIAVTWVGYAHGILFVFYVLALALITWKFQWKLSKSFLAFVLASVPFGTFWFDRKYLSRHN